MKRTYSELLFCKLLETRRLVNRGGARLHLEGFHACAVKTGAKRNLGKKKEEDGVRVVLQTEAFVTPAYSACSIEKTGSCLHKQTAIMG